MGRNKEFDRTDVLDKALQLFWRNGFTNTSLKDIEEATGVFKPSLYAEFKDKEGLFLASLRRYGETYAGNAILVRKPLGWKNIEDFLKIVVPKGRERGCYGVNLVRELSVLPGEVKGMLEAGVKQSRTDVQRNLEAQGVKRNLEQLSELILTFYYGLSARSGLEPAQKLENQVEAFIETLRKTITVNKPRR